MIKSSGKLMRVDSLKRDLQKLANNEKAIIYKRFFKTAPGEYGHGDKFLGVTVPQTRSIAKKYKEIDLVRLKNYLSSPYHEVRLASLFILSRKFEKADERMKKKIFNFYLENTKYINNWDLVDLSADKIIGRYLQDKPKKILQKLAKSQNLWEKRIAILATFNFIKQKKPYWTLKIANILLKDKHDLIHKAVGWMLREVGKRVDENKLKEFLNQNAEKMPRTMLRYAIERFPDKKRKEYLSIKSRNR